MALARSSHLSKGKAVARRLRRPKPAAAGARGSRVGATRKVAGKLLKAGRAGLDLSPLEKVSRTFRSRVDKQLIPGYCFRVLHKGKILYEDSYGSADPALGSKYSPSTICRLYSMSKPLVTACVLKLQEQGKLKVSDRLSKHIPAFRQTRVIANGNSLSKTKGHVPDLTILHCLTHTAGVGELGDFNYKPRPGVAADLCYHELNERVERREITSLEQFCDELAAIPLRYEPGKMHDYSFATDILGRVVEVASGMSLGAYMQKELFGPLGMKDTAFSVPKSKAKRLAALYCGREQALKLSAEHATPGGWGAVTVPSELSKKKAALCRIDGHTPAESQWIEGRQCPVESAAGLLGANMGGLVSTLEDFSRFMAMLANGGSLGPVQILKPETVAWALQDHLPELITSGKQVKVHGRRFGWNCFGELGLPSKKADEPREFEPGETGWGGKACTEWMLNPPREVACIAFSQQMEHDLYDDLAEMVYVAARKSCPITRPL